ncbi:cytochrome c [Geminicoccus roseus]|uniref:cytochrome c n=1 Tax=Geminicoccus roseus TaxID=404900 RepID=UPI000414320E|nr:cytochrome c [Geminicoccus roseus]
MAVRNRLLASVTCLMLVSPAAWGQDKDEAALVAKGEYLARAADCMPCHTAPGAKPFSGGLGMSTPFGTLFSVNITPDKETGIGAWTFDQFKAALHDGVRADGAYLYPAMPFDAYTKITDEDLQALWAYFRSLPPVKAENKANQLEFPFSIRLGMLAWRELFFTPQTFTPTAGKSEAWNRGAYLVEALGHCSDCHTPRNLMGAVKGKEHFIGAEIDGFYAPQISAAALADNWTSAELKTFLKTGTGENKTSVFGPMADVVEHSLSHLTDADLDAMVTYLLDSPPPQDVPTPQKQSPLPADVYQSASKLYIDQCATCHQPHGTGIAGSVPPLKGNPAVTATEPYNVLAVVLDGLPSSGKYDAMPSFAGRLSDRQVADLANYVRTSWGNDGAANATAKMAGVWRSTTSVPDVGTESAAAFQCPQVGGAPGGTGPDAQAVQAVAEMVKGGNRNVHDLVDAYQAQASGADPAEIVNAVISAYCPAVAADDTPAYMKQAELERVARQAAADVSPATAAAPLPDVDLTWAVQVGHSVLAREAKEGTTTLACPPDNGKLVPAGLVASATAIFGKPALPVTGKARQEYVDQLLAKEPKASEADIANALIMAHCARLVADQGVSEAERRTWQETFGQEVIQGLQMRTARAN